MSRKTLAEEGHEKLDENRLGVVTQGIPVVTRTSLLKNNLCRDIIKVCCNTIQE